MRAWHPTLLKGPVHLVPNLPPHTSDNVSDSRRIRLRLYVSLLSCLVCRLVAWRPKVQEHELEVDGRAEPHNVQDQIPYVPQHRVLHSCRASVQRHQQRQRICKYHHPRPVCLAQLNGVRKPRQAYFHCHTFRAVAAGKRPSSQHQLLVLINLRVHQRSRS
ncbi:hypothetical protein TRVL_03653 [Trypanosoma vivax]|nr:hypothetical protein TRVL_03653 [Trypanosoma vivax]